MCVLFLVQGGFRVAVHCVFIWLTSNNLKLQDSLFYILPMVSQIRHIKGKHSLAALMKLLWYWYVMRGAGSTLETQKTETSGAESLSFAKINKSGCFWMSTHLTMFSLLSFFSHHARLHSWTSVYRCCLRSVMTPAGSQWGLTWGPYAGNVYVWCVCVWMTGLSLKLSIYVPVKCMCVYVSVFECLLVCMCCAQCRFIQVQ